jgi:hypothetical protein
VDAEGLVEVQLLRPQISLKNIFLAPIISTIISSWIKVWDRRQRFIILTVNVGLLQIRQMLYFLLQATLNLARLHITKAGSSSTLFLKLLAPFTPLGFREPYFIQRRRRVNSIPSSSYSSSA